MNDIYISIYMNNTKNRVTSTCSESVEALTTAFTSFRIGWIIFSVLMAIWVIWRTYSVWIAQRSSSIVYPLLTPQVAAVVGAVGGAAAMVSGAISPHAGGAGGAGAHSTFDISEAGTQSPGGGNSVGGSEKSPQQQQQVIAMTGKNKRPGSEAFRKTNNTNGMNGSYDRKGCRKSIWLFRDWRAVVLLGVLICIISQIVWAWSPISRDALFAWPAGVYNCSISSVGLLALRAFLRVHAAFDGRTRRCIRPFEISSIIFVIVQLILQIIYIIIREPMTTASFDDMEIGGRINLFYQLTNYMVILPMIAGVVVLTYLVHSSLRFVLRTATGPQHTWTRVQRSAYRLRQATRALQIIIALTIIIQVITISLKNTPTSWYIVYPLNRLLLLGIAGTLALSIQPNHINNHHSHLSPPALVAGVGAHGHLVSSTNQQQHHQIRVSPVVSPRPASPHIGSGASSNVMLPSTAKARNGSTK
jgi:hypothetical protein